MIRLYVLGEWQTRNTQALGSGFYLPLACHVMMGQ